MNFILKKGKNYINTDISIPRAGVNVNIRMYNFDDVQCTVIPSAAYDFIIGMNH